MFTTGKEEFTWRMIAGKRQRRDKTAQNSAPAAPSARHLLSTPTSPPSVARCAQEDRNCECLVVFLHFNHVPSELHIGHKLNMGKRLQTSALLREWTPSPYCRAVTAHSSNFL